MRKVVIIMTEQITINGKKVYEGTVTFVSKGYVEITLLSGDKGTLFLNEITDLPINLISHFKVDSKIYVLIKKRCFDGTLVLSMKGLFNKNVSTYSKRESLYCTAISTCNLGTFVQITPDLIGLVYNIYLQKGISLLASVCSIDDINHRISLVSESVLYDEPDARVNLNYGDISIAQNVAEECAA